jgi:transglutaminase-like putative cysteine protease
MATGYNEQRQLRFTFGFSNSSGRHLRQIYFWCYLPAVMDGTQILSDIHVSRPFRLLEDAVGHRILELMFDDFEPYAQKVIAVTTEIECLAATKPRGRFLPDPWLGAERFIESNALPIRMLALELRAQAPLETTRAIYDWVRSNLMYTGYVAEDLGAAYALHHRRGDCTEYADLVVALTRANGIPARMIGGYVIDRDAAPKAQDYHNWAEVYVDGSWHVVDAQKENWFGFKDQYIAFRIYREVENNPIGTAHRFRVQGDIQVSL